MKRFEKNWVEIEQHIIQTCYQLKEKELTNVKVVSRTDYFKILIPNKGLKLMNLL